MRRIDCEQGSQEWVDARLGIPTASQFHRIITPKTLKPSGQADKYAAELIAEWMIGFPFDKGGTALMERGKELEVKAVQFYELETGNKTEKIGFCLRDDGAVGASPDRLVGADGLLEIKCPGPVQHILYLLSGLDADYRCQVQGQLWITGRQWLDFLSYHPDMPDFRVRVERDETFIAALAAAVDLFVEQLEVSKKRLIEMGAVPAQREAA